MIDPRNMALRDWADSVILDLGDAWAFGTLGDDTQWQSWATAFVKSPAFTGRVVPDPYQFADWRDWAMRVYPLLEVTNA